MSSQSNIMFNAMEAGDWNKVTEIIATTSLTKKVLKGSFTFAFFLQYTKYLVCNRLLRTAIKVLGLL